MNYCNALKLGNRDYAQPRPGARAAEIRVAPAIYAFNGGTMDRGILYILIALAAFWLSVAGLVLLVT